MIQIIKLINGTDVIADISCYKEGFIKLKDAFTIVMSREGLGLMPFMLFSKEKEFNIAECNILAKGEPETEIRNAYSSQTGGVVLAENNMIITD